MRVTQTESGKAWEYGLARQCADMLNSTASLVVNAPRNKSQESYDLLPQWERNRIDRAANETVCFLRAHDSRLIHAQEVMMQSDQLGAQGDVRDIVINTPKGEVGISAKHRHDALKHSRLSDRIDFGNIWYDQPCSMKYWSAVNPVFDDLKRREGTLFRAIGNKFEIVYKPLLNAFIDEVNGHGNPKRMMRYLLGKRDFYKISKENGTIALQSFNLYGSLEWGKRLNLPNEIIRFALKPRSNTTAVMHLSGGWQVSFRIHNANSRVEPSLKFDVRLEGCPTTMSRHEIPYG